MPEAGISRHAVEVGLLAGLGNLFIFTHFMPPIADVRQAQPFDQTIEKSERTALLIGTGWTVLVTAYTKKAETFAIAGGILAALDYGFKHANAVNPQTGTMKSPNTMGQEANVYSMPDYTEGTG